MESTLWLSVPSPQRSISHVLYKSQTQYMSLSSLNLPLKDLNTLTYCQQFKTTFLSWLQVPPKLSNWESARPSLKCPPVNTWSQNPDHPSLEHCLKRAHSFFSFSALGLYVCFFSNSGMSFFLKDLERHLKNAVIRKIGGPASQPLREMRLLDARAFSSEAQLA